MEIGPAQKRTEVRNATTDTISKVLVVGAIGSVGRLVRRSVAATRSARSCATNAVHDLPNQTLDDEPATVRSELGEITRRRTA